MPDIRVIDAAMACLEADSPNTERYAETKF